MRLLAVNFHYIRDAVYKGGIFPVSPARFRAQIEELAKYYRFVSQQDLLAMRRADSFPRGDYALITFDDNFKEQWAAIDILTQLSVPAICYATTMPSTLGQAHHAHKLHFIMSQMDEADILDLLGQKGWAAPVDFEEPRFAKLYRYDTPGLRQIKILLNYVLPEKVQQQAIDHLFAALVSDEAAFVRTLYFDAHDLRRLAVAGMLGTHTKSHKRLGVLDAAETRAEIADSITALRTITGQTVQTISYPFGIGDSVSDTVAALAEKEGLELGLTMNRGLNTDDDLRRGLMLRRVDTNDAPGGKNQSREYYP